MKNNRKITLTADGSNSIWDDNIGEHFHSIHGAVAESQHIFIEHGFLSPLLSSKEHINLLEIGFGTGLNILLTYFAAQENQKTVFVQTIEQYPLEEEEYRSLNYGKRLHPYEGVADVLMQLHTCRWGESHSFSPFFTVLKTYVNAVEMILPCDHFDLVYFDAFSPDAQPEMWTKDVFINIYNSLKTGGILLTYSTKGDVKRRLRSIGFEITKLPGPVGKREILRAQKTETIHNF